MRAALAGVIRLSTDEDHKKAIRRVLRYPDQDTSLTDALGAETGERLDVSVCTCDHHLDVMSCSRVKV